MSRNLREILINMWFSKRESKVYLTMLELWLAPASSVARNSGESKTTVYDIIKRLIFQWYAQECSKNGTKYFSCITPQELFAVNKKRLNSFEKSLPDFVALANVSWSWAKTYFYEGLEPLKRLFFDIIETKENFRTFLGTKNISSEFESFLKEEFLPYRKTISTKTRVITSQTVSHYWNFNIQNHCTLLINDPLFDGFANEIILYDFNKVLLCLYTPEEISAVVIESQSLHDSLGVIYELLWKAYKK